MLKNKSGFVGIGAYAGNQLLPFYKDGYPCLFVNTATGIVISEVEKVESTLNDEAEQFVNILLTNEDGNQVIILVDYTEISMQTGNIKETVRI